jgi:hypothetical protein
VPDPGLGGEVAGARDRRAVLGQQHAAARRRDDLVAVEGQDGERARRSQPVRRTGPSRSASAASSTSGTSWRVQIFVQRLVVADLP